MSIKNLSSSFLVLTLIFTGIAFSQDMKLTNKLKDLEKVKKGTQVQDELLGRFGEVTQGSHGQKEKSKKSTKKKKKTKK